MTGPGRFEGDEHAADSGMVAHLLILSMVVLFAGAVYVFATQFTADANVDTGPGIAQWNNDEGLLQFMLITDGPKAPYNLDLTALDGRASELRFLLDGHECAYPGELTVEGSDHRWDVGERVTVLDDCEGTALHPFREYSITITLVAQQTQVYQDHNLRLPM